MNPVTEKIDERILRLLGLEDVFDLDYDTYLTLLKEEIVKGANRLPQEELALLANERKRIRGKKGRFTPKKEGVKVGKDKAIKFLKGSTKVASLPSAISKPDISSSQDNLVGIKKPLLSISKTLLEFLRFKKKTTEDERKEKETQRRTKKEENLEGFKKGVSAVSSAAKRMLAPFQSIIDRIWRFIFFTLLGRAFTQLMNWLGDPANKKKIEVLGRFLRDWWPTLLGAAGLFFTPFGKFVRGTLGIVGTLTGKLVKAIPKIASAVKNLATSLGSFAVANPLLTAGAITGTAAAAGYLAEKKRMEDIAAKQRTEIPKRGQEKGFLETIGQGFSSLGQLGGSGIGGYNSGGIILPRFSLGGVNFATGYDGIDGTTGQKVSGFGPDTQAIVAQPGEIVINKKTVDAVGAETFLSLNRQYGGPGANKPKIGRLYNTGGYVQAFGEGGIVGGLDSLGRSVFENVGGTIGRNRGRETGIPGGGWFGEQLGEREGRRRYEQITNPLKNLFGMQGGGSVKVRAENPRMNPRGNEFSHGNQTTSSSKTSKPFSLGPTIQRAQQRLVDRQGERNTNINNNVRPWYQRMNPFVDNRPYYLRLPGSDPNFYGNQRMPGYNREKWNQLNQFRNNPGQYKSNKKGSRLKYSPWDTYQKLGTGKPLAVQGGGLIRENTGMNIRGATADRQLAALQPGEYVLPVDTVFRLGGPSVLDKLVAMTDSNSNPFKKSVNKPQITPLSRGNMQGMITLPPISQSKGNIGNSSSAGSKVPSFSASSPNGDAERSMNASIYGIIG